jgi:hypothetical protein
MDSLESKRYKQGPYCFYSLDRNQPRIFRSQLKFNFNYCHGLKITLTISRCFTVLADSFGSLQIKAKALGNAQLYIGFHNFLIIEGNWNLAF